MKTIGAMLDCSRNSVRNVESLKKFIDVSEKIGMNRLYLYIEDTYEIEGEPYFGYMRGRYSIKELKEVNDYGKAHNVELVPCFQTLAHLNQTIRWPRYASLIDSHDVLMVGEEKVYELIDKMFASLSKAFDTKTFHAGMDEAFGLGRGRYLDEHGYVSKVDIFMKHLNRVNEIAHKYGKTLSIWSDMLYRTAHKSYAYYVTDTNFDQEFINSIPKDIDLVYWDYYHEDEKTYRGMIKGHKALGTKVSFASGVWTWTGFTTSNTYAFKILKPGMKVALQEGIDDIILTAWGDNGGECSLFATLPSYFYAVQVAKGITKMSEIKENFYKAFGIKWDVFMRLDLPNILDKNNCHTNPSKYLTFNDPFIGTCDSTLMGNENELYRSIYKKVNSTKNKMGEYVYLVDYMASLSKFLSVKACLGQNTRKAYASKDVEALKNVVKDYKLAIKYLKDFIKAFKAAWYKENKSFGFEIQEARLGGLLLRLSNCIDELNKYINKEISNIPELDEPVLDLNGFKGEELEKKTGLINAYTFCASMNIF